MSHTSQMNLGLRVDANVTIAKLQEFLGDKGSDSKLYAKKQGDGFVLYIKPKYEGVLGKIADRLNSMVLFNSGRRQDARDALAMIVENTRNHINQTDETVRGSSISGLLGGLSLSITVGQKIDHRHSHRVGDMSKDLALFTENSKKSDTEQNVVVREKMVSVYNGLHVENDKKLTDPEQMEIKHDRKTVRAPVLTIDGERYEPKRVLGEGAFGRVIAYQSGDKEVAVKLPRAELGINMACYEDLKNAIKETQVHAELSSKIPNSVVQLKDIYKSQGFGVIVVSDLAKGGDVESVGAKLRMKSTGDGELSKEEGKSAILTVLKDFGTALDQMHCIGGMAHLDVKGANALLDSDGVAKLTDFGTSRTAGVLKNSEIFVPDTPYFTAPELLKVGKDRNSDTTVVSFSKSRAELEKQEFKAEYLKIFQPDDDSVEKVNGLIDDLFQSRAESMRMRSGTELKDLSDIRLDSTKADVWSFGTTVLHMLTGELVLKDSDNPKRDLIAFMDGDKPAIASGENGERAVGSLMKSTGDKGLDEFLNYVLTPKPEDRPTMQQVISHTFLTNQPGIGSERSREILKGIVSGTI